MVERAKTVLPFGTMNASTLSVTTIPSIAIFVRHKDKCPNKDDEVYRSCRCPKHLRYTVNGKQVRQSARTRFWKTAEDRRRALESSFAADASAVTLESCTRTTTKRAIDLFITDKRTSGMTEQVIRKYERELGRFEAFMEKRSKFLPHDITAEDITEFRKDWAALYPSSTTRGKVQERLRAFLKHCYNARLIDRIPQMGSIKVTTAPTLPLSAQEYERMLEVVPKALPETKKAARTRALILLMRYTGLSIRDAVTLERVEFMKDGNHYRVITARQKTGIHVSVLIPPSVADEVLAAMKLNASKKYIFWNTGTGKPQSAVTNWQHDLREVFRAAGMDEGHPHQLRDTFAVGLLEKGVPLEEVSKLLGHTSIKTTEKHYAPWVKARQARLDALVAATWD
jgi:integrase/recombinase XerD